jgi:hypothetical protein
MSDLIKLVPKSSKSTEELERAITDEYYIQMEAMKPDLNEILTLAYTHDGELIVISNGLDAKSALWIIEEFKLNCLSGTFNDYGE